MRTTIERDALKGLLSRVAPAVDRKSQRQALACVQLVAADGALTACTTNMDVRITTSAPSQNETDGTVLVPHETITRLVGRCPAGAVNLAMDDDDVLHVNGGRMKAHLRTVDRQLFPAPVRIDGAKTVELGDDWQAFGRVLHAAAVSDAARPTLEHLHVGDGLAETTDSYRLARHTIAFDGELLIPAALLNMARKVAPDGPMSITWLQRRIRLSDGVTTWEAMAIEAQWPPTNQLIPASPPVKVTCDRAALIDAATWVTGVGDEQTTGVDGKAIVVPMITLAIAPDVIVATATNEHGKAEVEVEARSTVDGSLEVAFNVHYLLDAIRELDDDTVTLKGTDNLKPWLATEGDLTMLLMPVRKGGR